MLAGNIVIQIIAWLFKSLIQQNYTCSENTFKSLVKSSGPIFIYFYWSVADIKYISFRLRTQWFNIIHYEVITRTNLATICCQSCYILTIIPMLYIVSPVSYLSSVTNWHIHTHTQVRSEFHKSLHLHTTIDVFRHCPILSFHFS